MDTLKDFWTELDNRISSPLFASFIISWLVCNWRIPVALIFIKQNELGAGYYSYFDLIEKQATLLSFTWPAIIAVIYTFGYPHLKEFVTLYLSKKDIAVNEKLILHTADTNIPIAKFSKIQADLHKTQVDLATFYREESQIHLEVEGLRTEKKDLENKIEDERLMHERSIKDLQEKSYSQITLMTQRNSDEIEQVRSQAFNDNKIAQERKVEQDKTIQSLRAELSVAQIEVNNQLSNLNNSQLDHDQEISRLKRELEDQILELKRANIEKFNELEVETNRLHGEISDLKFTNANISQELADTIHVYNIEETQRMKLEDEVVILKNQISEFEEMKHSAEIALRSAFSLEKDVLEYVDESNKEHVSFAFLFRKSGILETTKFDF